jgi:hypothetical protein
MREVTQGSSAAACRSVLAASQQPVLDDQQTDEQTGMYARDGPSTTLAGSQLLGSKTRNQLMSIHRNCGKVDLKLCTPPSVEKMQHCKNPSAGIRQR